MTAHSNVSVFPDKLTACKSVAADLAAMIREINASGRNAVLGLATGSTPITLYKELIRLHKDEGLSFSKVTTFNLDEYLGLESNHPESYWHFMHQQLFNHIDIPAENINIPSGTIEDVETHCAQYETAIKEAGGIDFQLLGIGRTGHIGFNEPGSPKDSLTRKVHLDPITRQDAAPSFDGIDNVPTDAITMGCGTILAAKSIVLLGFGSHKASILKEAICGPISDKVSASFLQEHPSARFILDEEAAAEL